jgi:hypothetical protein
MIHIGTMGKRDEHIHSLKRKRLKNYLINTILNHLATTINILFSCFFLSLEYELDSK